MDEHLELLPMHRFVAAERMRSKMSYKLDIKGGKYL
jgi:hypothetical protein